LAVLSEAEQEALYGLPDFDDAQRLEYLALTEIELAFASRRPGIRVHWNNPQKCRKKFPNVAAALTTSSFLPIYFSV
jgi:hypothetical protein